MNVLPMWHPLHCRLFEWLAVDSDGNVALFSNAGNGDAPSEVLRYWKLVDEATDSLRQLPAVGEAVLLSQGSCDFWTGASERGLVTYDWKFWGGPYAQVATPSIPLKLQELPVSVQNAARLAPFSLVFPRHKTIASSSWTDEPPGMIALIKGWEHALEELRSEGWAVQLDGIDPMRLGGRLPNGEAFSFLTMDNRAGMVIRRSTAPRWKSFEPLQSMRPLTGDEGLAIIRLIMSRFSGLGTPP